MIEGIYAIIEADNTSHSMEWCIIQVVERAVIFTYTHFTDTLSGLFPPCRCGPPATSQTRSMASLSDSPQAHARLNCLVACTTSSPTGLPWATSWMAPASWRRTSRRGSTGSTPQGWLCNRASCDCHMTTQMMQHTSLLAFSQ